MKSLVRKLFLESMDPLHNSGYITFTLWTSTTNFQDQSCRTGDYKLYISPEIANLFFLIYHQTLTLELQMKFENDSISIRRTKKSFSRIAIDLTLELE
jgi:hypothetical protein